MLPSARRGLSPSLVFRWNRLMGEAGKPAVRAGEEVLAASEIRYLEEWVRELERLLGGQRQALEQMRAKTDVAVALAASRRFLGAGLMIRGLKPHWRDKKASPYNRPCNLECKTQAPPAL